MRAFLAAFGDAGHVFPMIALGKELRARGHEVAIETYTRWQPEIEALAMRFYAAPEFPGDPDTKEFFIAPFKAAEQATPSTHEAIADFGADVVVSDILTIAPALAGELAGLPVATLIPHMDPRPHFGHPPYSVGARYPATAVGRAWWGLFHPLVLRGGRLGRDDLNDTRERVGLPRQPQIHNGISEQLAIVGSFPQLEYPRGRTGPNTHVVGPLVWEPPTEQIEIPVDERPLVLVAPSTAHDPDGRLISTAARALQGLPVRLLLTTNRREPKEPLVVSDDVIVVDWLSYDQAMPLAAVTVCHGGYGTMAKALAHGSVPVIWPAAGDMGENAARADWAGAAVRIPRRALSERTLRLAVQRALGEPGLHTRAGEFAAWYRDHDPAGRAAALVQQLAER